MRKHIVIDGCLQPDIEMFKDWFDNILFRGKYLDSYYRDAAPNVTFEHFIETVKPDLDVLKFETEDGEIYSGNFIRRAVKYFDVHSEKAVYCGHWLNLEPYLSIDRKPNYFEVEEVHDINWQPGTWGDDRTSCWWAFDEKSQGRLQFWHMAKKGVAGALLVTDTSCNHKSRMMFLHGENFTAIFNHYGFSANIATRIAHAYFEDKKHILTDCTLYLGSKIYVNRGVRFLSNDMNIDRFFRDSSWSDYDFKNPEMEEDRVDQMINTYKDERLSKGYCPTCGLPLVLYSGHTNECFRDKTRIE